jgi:hypothetical protein
VARSVSWASLAVWAAFGAAIVAGCGGAGGQAYTGNQTEGGTGADTGGSGSSSGGGLEAGSSSGSGSGSGGSSGDDASSPIDASLDIAFPDSFYGPEGSEPEGGQDAPEEGECSPAGITCQGNVAYDCSGGVLTTTNCSTQATNTTCSDGFGCVQCVPGTGTCSGNTGTACNSTGTGTVTNVCDPLQGESCTAGTGQCSGVCASLGASYIGCEYYAVTMLNQLLDQGTFYFAVSISNTGASTATVNIQGGALTAAMNVSIPAGQLQVITLPWVATLSCGAGPCCGDANGCEPPPPGTEIVGNGAYHIRSTQPVTAYEFNAYQYGISGQYSYTNDASLLIPVNAMTGNYRAASWPTWNNYPGTIAVIGTEAGTTVNVTAPAGTLQTSGGIGASGGTVTLNAGDVLQLESVLDAAGDTYGADLSGTLIAANKPVEVLGGHSCPFIPAGNGYCDHLEQIAFPIETLRGDYLVTPPYNENGGPMEWIKVIGVTANTHVTFDPASVSGAQTLNAGTVLTLQAVGPAFRVHSTDNPPQPFFVAQYMMGQSNFNSNCAVGGSAQDCGDPSESVAVATAQFRTSYQFVAPTSYTENWVNVIAPAGASVTVDGAAVGGFAAIGGSGYDWAHVALSSANNGVHSASSASAFGIEVYGYGSYTSYMYPGGLNLARQ